MGDGQGNATPGRRPGHVHGLEKVAADRRHLIAAQVRASTGFTWGRSEGGVARIVLAGPYVPPRAENVLARWLKAETLHAR